MFKPEVSASERKEVVDHLRTEFKPMPSVRLRYLRRVNTVLLRSSDTVLETIRNLYADKFSFAEMNAEAHAASSSGGEYECPQINPPWGVDRVDGSLDGQYSGAGSCSAVCGTWAAGLGVFDGGKRPDLV